MNFEFFDFGMRHLISRLVQKKFYTTYFFPTIIFTQPFIFCSSKSMPDDDVIEEDKCPDYDSTVWNVRRENSDDDNIHNIEDNSLCLHNSYAKLSKVVDETRHCPICIVSEQHNHVEGGHYEREEDLEVQNLLSNSPNKKKSPTSPSPSIHMDSLSTHNKSNPTENSPSKLASSSHSPLYQGEIFLYNDRQYLI